MDSSKLFIFSQNLDYFYYKYNSQIKKSIEVINNITLPHFFHGVSSTPYLLSYSKDLEADIESIKNNLKKGIVLNSGVEVIDFVIDLSTLDEPNEEFTSLLDEGKHIPEIQEFIKVGKKLQAENKSEYFLQILKIEDISQRKIDTLNDAYELMYNISDELYKNVIGIMKYIYLGDERIGIEGLSSLRMNSTSIIGVKEGKHRVYDTVEFIVHEASHLALFSIDWDGCMPLFKEEYKYNYDLVSPIRGSKRTIFGLYHACYVIINLIELYLRLYEKVPKEDILHIRNKLLGYIDKGENGLSEIKLNENRLTKAGLGLFHEMEKRLKIFSELAEKIVV